MLLKAAGGAKGGGVGDAVLRAWKGDVETHAQLSGAWSDEEGEGLDDDDDDDDEGFVFEGEEADD